MDKHVVFAKLYHFFFCEHRKQFLGSLGVSTLALGWLATNVFVLGRHEDRVLIESISLTLVLSLVGGLWLALRTGQGRYSQKK